MVARGPVGDRPPLVLGPPLIGAGYVAADGCCDSIRHVRALLALNGHFTLAQRFAIDWEQLDAENRVVKGDTKTLANYRSTGGRPWPSPTARWSPRATTCRSRCRAPCPRHDRRPGRRQFVVLDIGGGSYVLYAHMQPGSVTVQPGRR